jgi:tRNA modification GTPase
MREAGDRIEAIGIKRTQQAMADADLVVVVVDGSTDLQSEDVAALEEASRVKHIVAVNKIDLPSAARFENQLGESSTVVHLSALTGEGLDDLTAAIVKPFIAGDSEAVGLMITDSRHYDLLRRAESSLEDSLLLLDQAASEELVLVGLHNALKFLGEITGETTTEDILGQIFSTFCIGK